MKGLWTVACCLCLFAGIGACSLARIGVTTNSTVTYAQADSTTAVAMLPVVTQEAAEGYRRLFAGELGDLLIASGGGHLGWEQSMERLNAAGLAESYAQAIQVYRTTAVLDRDALSRIGEALGYARLLFVAIETAEHTTSFEGLSGRQIELRAHCQIWNAVAGDVAWEASAVSTAPDYISREGSSKYRPLVAEDLTAPLATEIARQIAAR